MTSKERMLTALNRGKPDRLPVTIHQWQDYHLNHFMGGVSDIEANRICGLDASINFYRTLEDAPSPDWRVTVSAEPGTADYEGYCSAQYILPFESSDSLAAVGERMGGATLMAEADPEAEVVRELMDGEVVEVLERADSWALVRTIDGESGYVSQDMLGD